MLCKKSVQSKNDSKISYLKYDLWMVNYHLYNYILLKKLTILLKVKLHKYLFDPKTIKKSLEHITMSTDNEFSHQIAG